MKRALLIAAFIAISGAAHAGWDDETTLKKWTVISKADKIRSCRSLDFNTSATTNVPAMIGEEMQWCEAQPKAIRHKYGSRY
jgi:hypothetical protein